MKRRQRTKLVFQTDKHVNALVYLPGHGITLWMCNQLNLQAKSLENQSILHIRPKKPNVKNQEEEEDRIRRKVVAICNSLNVRPLISTVKTWTLPEECLLDHDFQCLTHHSCQEPLDFQGNKSLKNLVARRHPPAQLPLTPCRSSHTSFALFYAANGN